MALHCECAGAKQHHDPKRHESCCGSQQDVNAMTLENRGEHDAIATGLYYFAAGTLSFWPIWSLRGSSILLRASRSL